MTTGTETVAIETRDGALSITLDRPTHKNALDEDVRAGLASSIAEIERDRAVRSVVLAGSGGAFCAGGDLRGIRSAELDNDGWRERMKSAHAWLARLLSLDRAVVAADCRARRASYLSGGGGNVAIHAFTAAMPVMSGCSVATAREAATSAALPPRPRS